MKLKLEASPHNYPSNEAYAADVKEKMGIELDIAKISPNPVLRTLSKLAQNSLYGKFAQRDNMTQTEFVTDLIRFNDMLVYDKIEISDIVYISNEMAQVIYKYRDHFVKNNFNTNIFFALFTTSHARLKLYEQLSALGENVIYYDTDSVIYKDNGKNSVQMGEILGDWSDELAGGYIEKFLSTGPKSYYFKTNTGKETTKVKGFTLHHKNAEKINGINMEKLINREVENLSVEDNQITRDVKTKQLVNKNQIKTFNFNFDKRIINNNYDTVPYGY